MKCTEYKKHYDKYSKLPLHKDIWDTPHWNEWMGHLNSCNKCSDWTLAKRIISRKKNPNDFPCVHIGEQVTRKCKQHKDPTNCSDIMISYFPKFDEYSITKLGSDVVIKYCPWCGVKLPCSKRNMWFAKLKRLGFEDPIIENIPKEFKSNLWFKRRKRKHV